MGQYIIDLKFADDIVLVMKSRDEIQQTFGNYTEKV